MTDHPIPDDLLPHLSLDAGVIAANGVPNSHTVHVASAVLHALAEWADGRLIDPDGWRRVKAGRVSWGWTDYDRAELDAPHSQYPDDPADLPLYTLTPAPEEETRDG